MNLNSFSQKLAPIVAAAGFMFAAQPAAAMYVTGPAPQEFSLLSTAWNPGPNQARLAAGNPAPGSATWSIMGAGFSDVSGIDGGHTGLSQAITVLGFTQPQMVGFATATLNLWAAVSGFTNLGQVADGGVNAGTNGAAGALGDIRIGAWTIANTNVLAHAFQPGTQALFGSGGSILGDMHFNTSFVWVDETNDTTADFDFDLFTVMLHEFGHSLGLGHSTVSGSVMQEFYAGSRRSLHADDIAGIQAIYGPELSVPEPNALALMAMGLAGLFAVRRQRRTLAAQPA